MSSEFFFDANIVQPAGEELKVSSSELANVHAQSQDVVDCVPDAAGGDKNGVTYAAGFSSSAAQVIDDLKAAAEMVYNLCDSVNGASDSLIGVDRQNTREAVDLRKATTGLGHESSQSSTSSHNTTISG